MRLYELTYLITPELSEEEIKKQGEKMVSQLQEVGGILSEISKPIKKTLAYQIKKKTSAYLVTLSSQLAPEKLEEIEKKLKSDSNILRYLISTKGLPKEIIPSAKPPQILKPKPKKVELKEIEKKLEEILGQ
jgi:small subunit ribosomal protein S6